VAPLGTALTETQIELLWRMAPEPILCLDGDEAGQRAALRAAERALPLLKPGHSLRFASLPAGEDPDSLVRRDGAPALASVLQRTRPLADVIWEHAVATRSLDTPEQRAALEQALEGLATKIADRTVQWQYRRLFRSRLRVQFWSGPPQRQGGREGGRPGGRHAWRDGGREGARPPGLRAAHVPPTVDLNSAQVILCTLINHVDVLAVQEVFDQVETLHLADRRLDRLLHDLVLIAAQDGPLHRDRLVERLTVEGHREALPLVDRPEVLLHAPFARAAASFDEALGGLSAFLRGLHLRDLRRDLAQAEERLGRDMTPENWELVQTLRRLIEEEEAAAEQRDLFEAVPGLAPR
jgi:DNA primase